MMAHGDQAVGQTDDLCAFGTCGERTYRPIGAASSRSSPHLHGDYLYVRSTADGVRLGTDTFMVNDGKIVLQTVTIDRS